MNTIIRSVLGRIGRAHTRVDVVGSYKGANRIPRTNKTLSFEGLKDNVNIKEEKKKDIIAMIVAAGVLLSIGVLMILIVITI